MKKFFSVFLTTLLVVFLSISPISIAEANDGGYCGSLNSDPGDPWCVKTSANYCCIGGGGVIE